MANCWSKLPEQVVLGGDTWRPTSFLRRVSCAGQQRSAGKQPLEMRKTVELTELEGQERIFWKMGTGRAGKNLPEDGGACADSLVEGRRSFVL